ncbi:succinate dehydrogenase, cytochrome b556 subunit [Simiduia agarivorans]|uniref:Succinate dehydrogenase cytochrome b556 subunit n=1 Tax=Simiduia agarivorans (strain DSM 21679 / JCM 13881 / BCRC 17597 / SA1) TaxID=1117647 RepID=K4KE22_SIMAS|nr:succinate dehydrogenase, cytochrome b556 subunit [Simiduia agarivorans]AFU97279.1 Succinate dehydrogenase cytochrome b subunit [Simiduia agarivorans SA1 = DSM 21679]
MNKNRPVNLDISTIKLPITAYVSILHRISGVALFAGVAILLWMLEASLSSEASFTELKEHFQNPLCKLILWATLAALAYHMVAGIRHLIMDTGVGESLEGGQAGAKLVIAIAFIIIAALGVWIW